MRLPTWITPTRVTLLAIVAIAAVIRLWHVGDLPPGLYPDEAANGNDALYANEHGWEWFYPNNNGREGLFINLQGLALLIAGVREPWVLRIVSALAGIATVPGIYLLGRELWNRRVGLFAAALLATSFWHVTFSRIGFRAIMAPLLLTFGLALFLRGIRALRNGERKRWITVAGGALAGLGLHTYIAFRTAGLVFLATGAAAIWAAPRLKRVRAAKLVIAAGIAAIVVASPLLHYFVTHPGSFSDRAGQVSVLSAARPAYEIARNVGLEAGMLVTRGDMNWRHNLSGKPALPPLLFGFMLLGAAWAVRRLWRKRGKDVLGVTTLALIVAGAAPAVISGEGMPHALRGIMLVVPVMLLAAFGLERSWKALTERGWLVSRNLLVGGTLAFALAHTAIMYPLYVKRPEVASEFTSSYVELGRELLERDTSVPGYVIVPRGDVLINGIPVAAQTTMFISGTASSAGQERLNVRYVTDAADVPSGAITYIMK